MKISSSTPLFFASIILLPNPIFANESDFGYDFDIGASLLPGIGIEGEESLMADCGKEQESIRLLKYTASMPETLFRIENRASEVTYTFRSFENRREVESETFQLQPMEWDFMVAELVRDSFWTPSGKQTHMRVHGPKLVLEVCLSGHYRYQGLDPEFEKRMDDLWRKLVKIRDAWTAQKSS